MKITKLPNLEKELGIEFEHQPLLVGGLAKEFYGVRKAGPDVDFILAKADHNKLKKALEKEGLQVLKRRHRQGYKKRPQFVNLFGDRGILYKEFEVWDSICGYDYGFLSEGSVAKKHCRIISLEKLLFLTALAIGKEKYYKDTKLIVKRIFDRNYK